MERCGAIVLAAGSGSRMKQEIPKQFLLLKGIPLFLHSVRRFAEIADEVVLVTGEASVEYCRDILYKDGLDQKVKVAAGGKERYHSSMAGLRFAKDWDYVMIHDAARACVSPEVIRASLETAKKWGSGVAAVPAKDTIKRVGDDGFVEETLERSLLRVIQTPQTFRTDWILQAYRTMEEKRDFQGVTDDAMVLERFGGRRVYLSEGSYANIKITTPEDMIFAEAILSAG